MATDDDHDTCTCGAHVDLTENALRKRARIIGCKACEWTGVRPSGVVAVEVLGE